MVTLQSATSQEVLTSHRVAWDNYIELYGRAASSERPPGDKGKGRASSSKVEEVEEGDSEVVAHELEDSSGEEEASAGKMDVS